MTPGVGQLSDALTTGPWHLRHRTGQQAWVTFVHTSQGDPTTCDCRLGRIAAAAEQTVKIVTEPDDGQESLGRALRHDRPDAAPRLVGVDMLDYVRPGLFGFARGWSEVVCSAQTHDLPSAYLPTWTGTVVADAGTDGRLRASPALEWLRNTRILRITTTGAAEYRAFRLGAAGGSTDRRRVGAPASWRCRRSVTRSFCDTTSSAPTIRRTGRFRSWPS